jgi:hypothetical protein
MKTGAGDIDHIQVVLLDDPVQVHVDKIQARRGAPVSQQARLDVFQLQGLFQQRIVVEINLAHRQIVGGAPVGIHLAEHFRGKGLGLHGSILLFSAKAENAANRLGYHPFLVRVHDADRNPAGP